MKVIAVIKSTGRDPYPLVRHCFLPSGRSPREVSSLSEDGSRIAGILNGLNDGAVTMHPMTDTKSLSSDVIGRNALRHVILSAEPTVGANDRQNAFNALLSLAEEWVARFAPGTPHIGICHDDRESPHVHLLMKNLNSSTGGRLSWSPGEIREMQSFDWVSPEIASLYSIESGRGQGKTRREGTGHPYPYADKLDAKTIAAMNQQEIYEHTRKGAIQIGRRNKQGNITSITFNGRRIRLNTIRQFVENPRVGSSQSKCIAGPRNRNPRVVRIRSLRTPSVS